MWMGNDTRRNTKAPATKGKSSSPNRGGGSQCTSEMRGKVGKKGAVWGAHKGIRGLQNFFKIFFY